MVSMSDLGSSRKFIWSIVTSQMLVQIGAFSGAAVRAMLAVGTLRREAWDASTWLQF